MTFWATQRWKLFDFPDVLVPGPGPRERMSDVGNIIRRVNKWGCRNQVRSSHTIRIMSCVLFFFGPHARVLVHSPVPCGAGFPMIRF